MKKILVPTDFSSNADKALNYAIQIAKEAKATIIIMHTCDLLELTFKDNLGLKKEFNRKIIMEAKEKLSLFKKSIEDAEKVKVQIKLYDGFVTDSILQAAKATNADLIVMGTLGNAGIKERIMGSKTAGTIGKTSIPLLAVPLLSDWSKPGKILVAINSFTENTTLSIAPVFELARLFNAELYIIKVAKDSSSTIVDYLSEEKRGIAYVKKLQTLYKKTIARFVHLDGRKFEKTIEKYIEENNIDIIGMITHKRNFPENIFHPSKTKRMSYHSAIPLLAMPA